MKIFRSFVWALGTAALCASAFWGASTFAQEPGSGFCFRADWFAGDMLPRTDSFTDKYSSISTGGANANAFADYTIDFPESGDYELWAFYAADDPRPMSLYFDGTKLTDGAVGSDFGSWMTSAAKWEKQVDLNGVQAGEHVVRLQAYKIDIPHVCAFKVVPKFNLSSAWNVPRPLAKEKIDAQSDWRPSPWSGGWYEYIARDRNQKKESGEAFTDHFARETALALVPNDAVKVAASDKPFGADSSDVDLCDELTYVVGMFAEQNAAEDAASSDAADKPVYVRVEIARPADGSAEAAESSALPQVERFVATREKLAKLLDRTDAQIDRFRQDSGDDAYLTETKARVAELREKGANVDGLDFADLYCDAVRLYARTAWANPILDFEKLIFVQRNAADLGLPQNYQSNCVLNRNGFDDALETLALPFAFGESDDAETDAKIASGEYVAPKISTLFRPDYPTFLGDVDLHFDAEKALVSSMGRDRIWNVFEVDLNAAVEKKSTDETMKPILPNFPEADSYDACYLPDDSVVFTSTACYIGVPCVSGTTRVTNTYRLNADGSIRRLTFDQEHNWCPTLTPDGRVLYQRWEYTDIPHVPGRLLFEMNPDGTNQLAFYGSNSLWPVSMLYARPIPGSTTKFACIVSGHHGVSRMGELVLFDVQQGRREEEAAVERICGYPKKVESRTDPKYHSTLWGDNIADESWPKFLQPFPLSEDYYLVAGQPDRDALWGLYLVDRFDNMVLLAERENFACFEPTPWRETDRPPVVRDRVDLSKTDATVYVADVYFGEGLKNVPRGTVKNLRLYSYNYLYPNIGGATGIIGVDGPWDVRQILGTVPVNEDGSALFSVPANVPIALQPLDENGEALQQMRSWFTAMPGEFLSCVGCHEDQNSTSSTSSVAFTTGREVEQVRPWYGEMRGFSFDREVQPVLDRYCVACHDGEDHNWGAIPFELKGGNIVQDYDTRLQKGEPAKRVGKFSTAYLNLAQFVRRPGIESDYFLLNPTEFSANTTELYQILANDHYGVQMDAEAWDRLLTWIDMNTPFYGSWHEFTEEPQYVDNWNKNRKELLALYANFDDVSETARGDVYDPEKAGGLLETPWSKIPVNPNATDWEREILTQVAQGKRLFPDGAELKARFEASGGKVADGVALGKPEEVGFEVGDRYAWDRKPRKTEVWGMGEPLRIPNDPNKKPVDSETLDVKLVDVDAKTAKVELTPNVAIALTKLPAGKLGDKEIPSFSVGTFEISNEQFELFDARHDSRCESRLGLSHGFRGFFVNSPERSVCRVSWDEAVAFCDWLSKKTGKKFRLPTADEWEYACRAGTTTPYWFGDWGADFSKSENLADQMLIEFIVDNYFAERKPLDATKYDDWIPKDRRFCDNGFLSERSGRYAPNPWGLFDMGGNVAEWTSTEVAPTFGVSALDGRPAQRVVCGGSWHDRPYRAASDFKRTYYPWQRVFDVGFRVICEEK